MTITTDLTQSKRLKELGAPQNTEFWHCDQGDGIWTLSNISAGYSWDDFPGYGGYKNKVSAYTLGELVEWLSSDFGEIRRWDDSNTWTAYPARYRNDQQSGYRDPSTTEPYDGPTPLDAVFALAEAIHGGKE